MPILEPHSPLTAIHRRIGRIVVAGLGAIGAGLGAWEAYSCAAVRIGYIASYSYGIAFFLSCWIVVIGLPLLIWWRTRAVGFGLVAAGFLSYAIFYGGMAVLTKLDRVAWMHDPPPRRMSLNDKASLVIYFQPEVSDQQIEDFRETILTGSTNRGYGLPPFVETYWSLGPEQANGHRGAALFFFDGGSKEQEGDYLGKIKQDRRVYAVYTDVAPSTIPVR